jgi:hypothetical protein
VTSDPGPASSPLPIRKRRRTDPGGPEVLGLLIAGVGGVLLAMPTGPGRPSRIGLILIAIGVAVLVASIVRRARR